MNVKWTINSRERGNGSKNATRREESRTTETDLKLCGRRSGDLELEISKLKRQLSVYESTSSTDWASVPVDDVGRPFQDIGGNIAIQDGSNKPNVTSDPLNRILSTTVPGGTSPESPDESSVPGATTIPTNGGCENGHARYVPATSSKSLGNIELSAEEIDELFEMWALVWHVQIMC